MIENNNIKLSVIIPIYNAEKYLINCLNSILNQTYQYYEVIMINDGSKDKSETICKEFADIDARFKYFKKENGGVSTARNLGLKMATGVYVLFVDADDSLINDAFRRIIERILTDSSDTVIFGMQVSNSSNRRSDGLILNKMNPVVSGREIITRTVTIDEDNQIYGYCWRYLYSKEIINNFKILFDESLRISEDYMFIVQYMLYAKRVSVLPEDIYIYNVNDGSVTSNYLNSLENDMYKVNTWIERNIYSEYEEVAKNHNGCIANAYLGFVQNLSKPNSPYRGLDRLKTIYAIKKERNYKKNIDYTLKHLKCRKKAYYAFILFKFNFEWLYVFLYSIKEKRKI